MAESTLKSEALTGHLKELRKRLIVSIVALVIGFALSYALSEQIYAILTAPLLPQLPEGSNFLAFTNIVEPFYIYLKVGLLGAIILASPVILHQIWGFAAPGLVAKEKRWFLALVAASTILFLAGILFAYFVVFPFGFKFLMGYATEDLKPFISMHKYFTLVTRLLLAFGVVYQLPLCMLVVARLGIVSAAKMLSWWRYSIVGIFLVSAIVTPTPDIFNQLLMAGPLIVLYTIGIILARLFGKEAVKKAAKESEDEDGDEESDGYNS
jgi:sec-independent protein translocase protein TatC